MVSRKLWSTMRVRQAPAPRKRPQYAKTSSGQVLRKCSSTLGFAIVRADGGAASSADPRPVNVLQQLTNRFVGLVLLGSEEAVREARIATPWSAANPLDDEGGMLTGAVILVFMLKGVRNTLPFVKLWGLFCTCF